MISVKEATKNYINGGKGKTTMPLGRMESVKVFL